LRFESRLRRKKEKDKKKGKKRGKANSLAMKGETTMKGIEALAEAGARPVDWGDIFEAGDNETSVDGINPIENRRKLMHKGGASSRRMPGNFNLSLANFGVPDIRKTTQGSLITQKRTVRISARGGLASTV